MIKAGFLIDSLYPSQRTIYLTASVNALASLKPNLSICAFYRDIGKPVVQPLFAVMQEYEAWNFNGIVIATDNRGANALLNAPSPKKKFFYVWEPEWAFIEKFDYEKMARIYQSDEIELIARSTFHYDILSNLWKEPVKIIQDFNHEQVAEFLTEQSQ